MDNSVSLETLLLYADADPGETAVAPPIHPTVHFAASSAEEFEIMNNGVRPERSYRRYGNPTQARLQNVMAAIEGADAALATASGMGAISSTVFALLSGGDHVVAQRSIYAGTSTMLQDMLPRFGITATLVDQTDPAAFAAACTPRTKLFMLETPSNPLLRITDLAAVSALARDRGILTFVDSTVATPVNSRPLDHGVDLVMHSVTKALSGHSDVQAGIVLGRVELIERIWETHTVLGSVISPFDAWLALRGLRTLSMRVERQNQTALTVATFLEDHPAVRAVNYPGLASHPQHDLASRQMSGYGCLLSFEPHGGYEAANRLIDALRLPVLTQSLGGVHSVITQPAAMWRSELTDEQLAAAGVPPGLIRLAIGLEGAADLTADFEQALATLPDRVPT